jgi:hypothetical protein
MIVWAHGTHVGPGFNSRHLHQSTRRRYCGNDSSLMETTLRASAEALPMASHRFAIVLCAFRSSLSADQGCAPTEHYRCIAS